MVDSSFYKSTEKDLIKSKLNEIIQKYGTLIDSVSRLTNVPSKLIIAFIFIESGGKSDAISGAGAVGLMQLVPAATSDIIHLENKQGRLSDNEKTILRKYIGNRLDCILKMKYMGHELPCNDNTGVSISKQDLLNPEFNILCGAIFLGILIDDHTEKGVIRLDKVVLRYNKGFFSKPKGNTVSEVLADAKLKGGKESESYILKLVGKNSVLDLIA